MAAGGGHWTKGGFVSSDDAVGGGGATGSSDLRKLSDPELYAANRSGKISFDQLKSELYRRHQPVVAAQKKIYNAVKSAARDYVVRNPSSTGAISAERRDGKRPTDKDAAYFRKLGIKGVSSVSYTANGIVIKLNLPLPQ